MGKLIHGPFIRLLAFAAVLFLAFPVAAEHKTPVAKLLGLDNEIGAYLHSQSATPGGENWWNMKIACLGQCRPGEQVAVIYWYKTEQSRNARGKDGLIGTSIHQVNPDVTIGKIILWVCPDGRRVEFQQSGMSI